MFTAFSSILSVLIVRQSVYECIAGIRTRNIAVQQTTKKLVPLQVTLHVAIPLEIIAEGFNAGIAAGELEIEIGISVAVARKPDPHAAG